MISQKKEVCNVCDNGIPVMVRQMRTELAHLVLYVCYIQAHWIFKGELFTDPEKNSLASEKSHTSLGTTHEVLQLQLESHGLLNQ